MATENMSIMSFIPKLNIGGGGRGNVQMCKCANMLMC